MNQDRPRVTIAPSLMCSDFRHLEEELRLLAASPIVGSLHVDVMDGHFVPNLTLGPDFVRAVRAMTDLPLDVHLMVTNPDLFLEPFARAGANVFTIHVEAPIHLDRSLRRAREVGCQAGVALNPGTPLTTLEYVLPLAEWILLMTVNPGFAGQQLVPYAFRKIADVRALLESTGQGAVIQVDGNTSLENIPKMIEAGATSLVAGTSCLYRRDRPLGQALAELEGFLMKKC